MSVQRRNKNRHITITKDTKEKDTTTRDKNMTILIGLLRFGEKTTKKNTIFFLYLCYINKNLIVLRGLSYLWLLLQ